MANIPLLGFTVLQFLTWDELLEQISRLELPESHNPVLALFKLKVEGPEL